MAWPSRRVLARLTLLLIATALLIPLAWQGASLLATDGQALAPVVGQYYQGEPWMATPTPSPAATHTLVPLAAASSPTPSATATVAPPPSPAAPIDSEAVRPTPAPFLVDAATAHGIDPTGTYVIVNQNAQLLTVVEAGAVLRELPISTGDPDNGWYTPAWSGQIGKYWGTFSANGAYADDAWYLFQASGTILIHSLPYTVDKEGNRAYQGRDELGIFPASRGCIRIAPEEARWFTDWGPQGVPIVILPWDGGTGREG